MSCSGYKYGSGAPIAGHNFRSIVSSPSIFSGYDYVHWFPTFFNHREIINHIDSVVLCIESNLT